jgi:hypothetical protein
MIFSAEKPQLRKSEGAGENEWNFESDECAYDY